MSTGWKWYTSDGEEFKSQMSVKKHLASNPNLKVFFSELSMAGQKITEVTKKFQDEKVGT